MHISLEEFHQHVVLAYSENFLSVLDIFDLLNPNSNDASAYMLSVLRFGWKKYIFDQKTFLACFEAFTYFSLSICIDNNFLIQISGDSTRPTYLFWSMYFQSKT